ncbi:hypothetical protein FO519_004498 [Halicephalobus sp. NKZ332]|nr:hypothetical protein FO519_004498 [Halicephalobus sp. NKZ332]
MNNCTNNTEAGIYGYRLESREIFKIELSSFNHKKEINPHAMSAFMNILFVTNSLYPEKEQDRVDIFTVVLKRDRKEFPKLKLQKSVVSGLMTGICGIAAIGKEHFYLANKHYFRNPGLRKTEVILKMNTGAILFFDGKKIQIILDNIPTPTGLAFDRKKRQLYVGCYSTNVILVFNANLAHLTKVNEIQLSSAPYFLSFDPFTQNLLVTAHPLKIRYLFYESYPHDYFSPSQVLEIKRKKSKDGKSNWSISQLYVNDGATISAATSALMIFPRDRPRQLLIGNVYSGILTCDVVSA